jgi:hypothetical protein
MNAEWNERVRIRAYEIWEREGRPEGGAERHWREAEEEVQAEDAAMGGTQATEAEFADDGARAATGTGTVAVGSVVDPDLAGTSR